MALERDGSIITPPFTDVGKEDCLPSKESLTRARGQNMCIPLQLGMGF